MIVLVLIFMLVDCFLGCLVGSFLTSDGYKMLLFNGQINMQKLNEWKLGLLFVRSKCDACGTKLGVTDLAPILSFILLRGHCRYCHHRISYKYPMIELITVIGFAAAGYLLNVILLRTLMDVLIIIATVYYVAVTVEKRSPSKINIFNFLTFVSLCGLIIYCIFNAVYCFENSFYTT